LHLLRRFHLAGVGNSTTTTGIPRLQEIFHASYSQRTVLTIRATVDDWIERHPSPRTLLDASRSVTYSHAPPVSNWALRCWRYYWEHRGKLTKGNWMRFELDRDTNAYEAGSALTNEFPRAVVLFTHHTDKEHAVAVCVGGKRALSPTEFKRWQAEIGTVIINQRIGANLFAAEPIRTDGFGTPVAYGRKLAFTLPRGADPRHAKTLPHTDPLTARFSNPMITADLFGIACARDVVIDEIKAVLDVDGTFVDPRHVDLLADTMCVSGAIQPFTRHGLAKSGATPLARASFETATRALVEAATGSAVFKLNGVTERIIMGQEAFIGTNGRLSLHLDEEKCAFGEAHNYVTGGKFSFPTPTVEVPSTPPLANLDLFASPADVQAAWSPVCAPASPTYSPSAPTYCASAIPSLDFFSQALSHPTYS
jgi:hypothetical protein